jgi:hypothetical protein
MANAKPKLKGSGDKESPCFRPFWIRKLSNIYLYGLYYTFHLNTDIHAKFYKDWFSHSEVDKGETPTQNKEIA